MFGKLTCICKSPGFDISKLPFSRCPLALVQHFLPLQIEHCFLWALMKMNCRIRIRVVSSGL